jgi:outer membrane protein assembly factor BamA
MAPKSFLTHLLIAVITTAGAAPAGVAYCSGEDAAAVEKADSTREDTSGYLILPVLYYTPETELAAGISGMRYFRPEGATLEDRPSKIWATLIFTQRSQYIADLFNELYFDEEKHLFMAGINYQKFPDKFYGVGPDTPDSLEEDYTPKTLAVVASFQERIRSGLNAGIRYEYWDSRISDTEPGGILDAGVIPGSEGGIVSGVGVMVNWDTRDNVFCPTTGSFHIVSAKLCGSALGSDYDFGKYVVDIRKYVSLSSSAVLAVQGLLSASTGVVPFQYMGQLGGQNILRGYYQGRYRDRQMAVAQVELRTKLWWRVGAAFFAGAGNVAPRLNDFDRDYVRYAAGFGIRYLFDEGESLHIRLDFGFAEGSDGMYITAAEAF